MKPWVKIERLYEMMLLQASLARKCHLGPFRDKFSSVQSPSRVQLFATPWIAAPRPPCPSPTPGVHPKPRPLSRWCHLAISSSVVPFSFCPQSLPASESFPMSQLFARGVQSTGVSALASFLPKNTQGWSPLEWTGWISLQSMEKCKSKLLQVITSHWSERPSLKSLQIINAGEGVEKKELSYTCYCLDH